ncbi:hypothetical protein [Chryseobacterium sp. MEBOG07]|uniref:hypothetical protein n=1 Tax=Chryseobacterium sp. MEBOG07 TaxID=2879939 RepID=UPI001F1DDC6B|nr:hypothetical protein [Chryseobacterium sp. MEBOG07]UKB78276.1 hypothetical protein LF886_17580 [Chryseobacterium sp. MEBOG07]
MKKIYYVPGLISAILIPVLFWYYGNQRVHPQYTIMDLGLPAKIRPNIPLDNTFEFYRNWNYKKIIVKPNTALQNQNFYVSELKELQAKNEKESGIEFIIDDNNSYQDFIALMDAMTISKQEAFCVDMEKTGHFFAVHFYKDPDKEIRSVYGCIVGGNDYREKENLNLIKPESFINHVPQQTFYIIFGFLLFVNISMFSIKENLQIQRKR